MTTSTRGGDRKAFTLTELLISMGIATLILGAILSALLYVGRTQYSLASYCHMNLEARQALELFGRDVKQFQPADGTAPLTFTISNYGAATETQTISCCIPDAVNETASMAVSYIYSKADRTFSRSEHGGAPKVLLHNISSFRVSASSKVDATGASTFYAGINAIPASQIKQLQIELATQSESLLARVAGLSSQQVTSAQFSIRRKL